jgi:hypothetical protein
MTNVYLDKIERASINLIENWRTRNWSDYLDDNYYFSKLTLAKTKWKNFDKDVFIEEGTFECALNNEIGLVEYRNEIKGKMKYEINKITTIFESEQDLPIECYTMIHCLVRYLLMWATTDCYSERARRIISAFPNQGIVVGFVKDDVLGQLCVYRPNLKLNKRT